MKKAAILLIILCVVFAPTLKAHNNAAVPDFETLFEEHGAVMLLIDSNTSEILYANKAAAEFYGYSLPQLESMKITQINILSQEETINEMQNAVKENRNYFVFRHKLANGGIRTVEVFSYPVEYEGRDVLFSIIHDITDKALIEEKQEKQTAAIFISGIAVIGILIFLLILLALNRRNIKKAKNEIDNYYKLINTFINADNNMVYLKDENFNYVFGNTTFQKFYNKTSEEILGMDDFAISDEEFAKRRRKSDKAAIENNAVITDEIERNGKIYDIIKFPVNMPNNKTGVGAYIRDITKERQNEKLLAKTSQRNKILLDILEMSFKSKQEQLDYVLHRALELTESKYGYIYYYDENSRQFTLNSWTRGVMAECSVANPQTKYDLEKTGIWGEVVRQRKHIIVNEFKKHNPLKKGYPKGHVQLERFMSVPILIDEKIVAVIGMANKKIEYDENDVFNLTLLMSGAWQDVQRREAEKQLSYERNKYLQTLISIGDAIMIVDTEEKVEMLNYIAEKLTGWTNEEAHGVHYKNVFRLTSEAAAQDIKDPVENALKTKSTQLLEDNAVLMSKNGAKYFLEDSAAPILDSAGNSTGVVLVFRDVTEKKNQHEKIEYLSFHDELTGLYNSRFFKEEMKRIDTKRNLPISIIMGDVNGLKLTNDVFGHESGDLLLKSTAEILRKNCRSDDIIARRGGDEFIILLPKTTIQEAENIVSRIKKDFSNRYVNTIRLSISLGADSKNTEEESILDIINKAEENMYAEKTVTRDYIQEEEVARIISTLHENNEKEKIHSDNVSLLCEKTGRELGLKNEEIKKLKDAGFYHDIGKIVLRKNLLDTGRQFTDEEKINIKKHPYVGYRILNSSNKTLDIAEYVLAHHERWDGLGYPKGLKGEEIPLIARIIAIAECYDRLKNNYDNIADKPDAVETLKTNASIKFDPKIVDVFLKMLKKDK